MKILDLSAGNRGIWFDKTNPLALFLDKRKSVNPDIVCDTRRLPKKIGVGYDLIVFDPPHMACGPNSKFAKSYGYHRTDEIRDIVAKSAKEAHRVSKRNALMAFKWNDHDQKLENILSLMSEYWQPLFGQKVSVRTKHSSQTYWVLLKRI